MTTNHMHYCNEPNCWANKPCPIHDKVKPVNGFKLLINHREPDPRKARFDKITEIWMIPLPCGHNYPKPEEMKRFNMKCEDCPCEYYVEMQADVIEFTRLNYNA